MKIKIMARECNTSCKEEVKLTEEGNDNKDLTDEDIKNVIKFAFENTELRHRIFDAILKKILDI